MSVAKALLWLLLWEKEAPMELDGRRDGYHSPLGGESKKPQAFSVGGTPRPATASQRAVARDRPQRHSGTGS